MPIKDPLRDPVRVYKGTIRVRLHMGTLIMKA